MAATRRRGGPREGVATGERAAKAERRVAKDAERPAPKPRRAPPAAARLRGEDRIIEWLRSKAGPLLGDDAAVLPGDGPWAITVDTQIAGTHVPMDLPVSWVARRLLRVNLSDLAATGSQPRWAFLALATPAGFPHRTFFDALLADCERYGVRLAGGDLARAPVLVAALTLVGRQAGNDWLRRADARAGDHLWVGGTLGEAALGCELLRRGAKVKGRGVSLPPLPRAVNAAARAALLRHLVPEPQLALGRWLVDQRRAAAIDVSDGLARDLHRLCRESDVRAEVDADAIPLADGARELARALDLDPMELALGGGEDYVLLFALPAGVAPPPRFGCVEIGRFVRGAGATLRRDGKTSPLPDVGWDHLEA